MRRSSTEPGKMQEGYLDANNLSHRRIRLPQNLE